MTGTDDKATTPATPIGSSAADDATGGGNVDDSPRLPDVPPEWVPLIDLPGWVARRYQLSVDTVASDLAEAVWTGSLRDAHRIRGVTLRPGRQGIKVPPPGIVWRRNSFDGIDGGILSNAWLVARD